MAWIETIEDTEWEGDLNDLKRVVTDPQSGQVDNIMSIHSLDPGSMKAHVDLYMQAMRGTQTLPKVDREMIALAVSKVNECHY